MNHWFRMYSEFANDPKVQSMSEDMQRRLVMIFCLQSSGHLQAISDEDVAFALRISPDAVTETKSLFVTKRFIDDRWRVTNWNKRQFKSDTSADRTRRYRAKIATSQDRHGDVTVTAQIQNRTEQNRTESDKDISASGDADEFGLTPPPDQKVSARSRINEWFDSEFWTLYPRKVDKTEARKVAQKTLPGARPREIILGLQRQIPQFERLIAAGEKERVPYPATWLKKRRWEDEDVVDVGAIAGKKSRAIDALN